MNREKLIFDYLADRGFATIAELAGIVYTSEATVRRCVKEMEKRGILKCVYGGVIHKEYQMLPVPIRLRDGENHAAKERLAQRAAAMIPDHATILIDSSTTARRICRHILDREGLTVITSSLRVCSELRDSSVRVLCTGGSLLPHRECFAGHFAEEFVSGVKADYFFFSAQGVSENGDITDSSEEEIALRKVMLSVSKNSVFLFDSSKMGRDYPFILCNTAELTAVLQD
ncbi:MAG: DeoR/GlpR transcriptional regulator [Ruminococcaceae bacterium]|nr:DeoR/GlpR transcriptional regulator [Oscillospiraceae bacterium]